ncbi:LysR family transcriptional regulator, partial [Acinetobacter baumannii]
ADHPSLVLFEDDYVVVGDATNPAMAQPMTRELYLELGHVTARFGKSRVSAFEDWFMRRQKQQRRVEVCAPSFLSLPGLILGTGRIA